jgi:hypothetical protein
VSNWEKTAAWPGEFAYRLRNGASIYTLVLHEDRAFATLYAGPDQNGNEVGHERIRGTDGIVSDARRERLRATRGRSDCRRHHRGRRRRLASWLLSPNSSAAYALRPLLRQPRSGHLSAESGRPSRRAARYGRVIRMARRLRVRVIERPGVAFFAFGVATIPDDGVIELSEPDAAAFLRRRGSARDVEILGWVDDDRSAQPQDPNATVA